MTFRHAFDRYEAEMVPAKSPATQKSNRYSLKRLRLGILGEIPVVSFHAYRGISIAMHARASSHTKRQILISRC